MKELLYNTHSLAPSSLIVAPIQEWKTIVDTLRQQVHPADYFGPQTEEMVFPNVAYVHSIRTALSTTPQGELQLVIIPYAHQMTKEVANALLKLIEEPPPSTYILLMAEHSHLIPTVRSRVQVFTGYTVANEHSNNPWNDSLQGVNLQTANGRNCAQRVLLYHSLRHAGLKEETILEPYLS